MERLRFKYKDGNEYQDLKEYLLGNISVIKTGDLNVQDALLDGLYPFYDRSVDVKALNVYSFDKEAIIYPGEGSKFYPRYYIGKFALHQRAYAIFDFDNKVIPIFIYHYLNTQNNHFLKTAVGSTVKSLRMNCFEKCKIKLPMLLEQEKIGGFLSSIDKLVDKQRKKVGLLKEVKKEYLQKIFRQELKFKDKNGNDFPKWRKTNLRNLSDLITKGTTPKTYTIEGINFIKVESIVNKKVDTEKCSYINSKTHYGVLKRSIIQNEDILFSIAGTLGRTTIITEELLPANTNQALAIIRLSVNNSVSKKYLMSNIYRSKVARYTYENVTVGAQPNLNLEQVGKFPIELPDIYEQEKIVRFLGSIDKLVEEQENKLFQYEQLKKGYMQRIFA